MSLTDSEVKQLTIGLFQQESERDKQKKVGASQISDPCTRHLAHALVQTSELAQKYWLGGKIGTAIHNYLESAIERSTDDAFIDSAVEKKIVLGELADYGIVSSKPDLYLSSSNTLIDWKTSTRAKTAKYRNHTDGIKHYEDAEYTMSKYIAQTQLYAWGLSNTGQKIEDIHLVFINRDGTNENDIWSFGYAYDESLAVSLWNRLETLWFELRDGAHPDNYVAHPQCYKCSMGI